MLQQTGIEDPYPLDATIEYESRKKLPTPIVATENDPSEKEPTFNYEDPEDTRYITNEMPEYSLETKADFKGNEEAAEWLMHDPNRFNVMPDDDTKVFFSDGDGMGKPMNDDPITLDKQDEQGHNNYVQENTGKVPEENENYLSDMDLSIINKAYSMDDVNKVNGDVFGMTTSNKADVESTKDTSSNNPNASTKNAPGNGDGGAPEGESTSSEPMIKITNDNDGISRQDETPMHSDSEEAKIEESQPEKQENLSSADKTRHEDDKNIDDSKGSSDGDGVTVTTNNEHQNVLPVYRISPLHGSDDVLSKRLHGSDDVPSNRLQGSDDLSNQLHGSDDVPSKRLHGSDDPSNQLHGSDDPSNQLHGSDNVLSKRIHGSDDPTNQLHGSDDPSNQLHGSDDVLSKRIHGSDDPTNQLHGSDDPSNQLHGSDDPSKRLSKALPLSESGTSRQYVHLNSGSIDTQDPQQSSPRLSDYSGVADMMLSRTEGERISGMYNLPQQTHPVQLLHSSRTPQEPVEGQSRH
ncbi:hypothetical protein QZH41_019758, partial [Actinostola sp. cb2023]